MTINNKKNTIEMTKQFAKAAEKFGTEEYKALQEVRRDYPHFKIVTVTRKVSGQKDTMRNQLEEDKKIFDHLDQTVENTVRKTFDELFKDWK